MIGDDLRGGLSLPRARSLCERILNRAMEDSAPDFHGSFKFTAQKGKVVNRQTVESERPDGGTLDVEGD